MQVSDPSRTGLPFGALDVCLIAIATLMSFVVNQLPFVLSERPDSIGDDGDSAFHVSIQMKLRDPQLFPKDEELVEANMASRRAYEFWIHRTVGWIADRVTAGDLLIANIAVFWVYNVAFLTGCYLLGRLVLGMRWGGAWFAIAATGSSASALHGSWGLQYAAVIPHDVSIAMCPWFLLAFLASPPGRVRLPLLFLLLGLAINIYPLYPLYLALLFLGVLAMERRGGLAFVCGLVFLAGAAPAIWRIALPALAWRPVSMSAEDKGIVDGLYAAKYAAVMLSPWQAARSVARDLLATRLGAFLFVGAAAMEWKRRTGRASACDARLARFTLLTLAMTALGLFGGGVWRPLVLFLFVRASAFLFVGGYLYTLWMAWALWTKRGLLPRLAACGLVAAILATAWRHSPARTHWIRGKLPNASTDAFSSLCAWAREETPPSALFLIPPYSPRGPYYAFRVYAERGVTATQLSGEAVISAPAAAVKFHHILEEIGPLYSRSATTAEFLRVARKYHADFLITDSATPSQPDLPMAYGNATYSVFAVPP